LLLHLSAECHSFVVLEDDAHALPLLPDNLPFSAAFGRAEASLMTNLAPYVKLFSTNRYYRFGFYDLHSYFILGAIGLGLALILLALLLPLQKLRQFELSMPQKLFISAGSVLVGVICGTWASRPVLFPLPSGVSIFDDYCCSQAHLYAGENSTVTRRIAEALLDAVDRNEMYDISLAYMQIYGKVTQKPLV
jgi:hypothetical protein